METDKRQRRKKSERRKTSLKENSQLNNAPTIPQVHNTDHSYDIQDRPSHHYKTEEERRERLEPLNDRYNLDYYSESD